MVDDLDIGRTLVNVGRTVGGPGKIGHAVAGISEVVGAGFDVEDEQKELEKAGIRASDLRRSYTRAARNKLLSWDERLSGAVVDWGTITVAGVAGSIAGGAAGSLVGMPWIGGIAGGVVAGFGAGKVCKGIATHEQDGVALAADCRRKQLKHLKQRQRGMSSEMTDDDIVSREVAFAQLMANIPKEKQARYEGMLEKLAGTRDFREAAQPQNKEGLRALRRMMNDPRATELAGTYAHLPVNPQNPDQHVADQYAELVNSGVLDARAIVLHPDKIRGIASRYYMEGAVRGRASAAYENNAVMSQQQLPSAGRSRQQEI